MGGVDAAEVQVFAKPYVRARPDVWRRSRAKNPLIAGERAVVPVVKFLVFGLTALGRVVLEGLGQKDWITMPLLAVELPQAQ